MNYLALDIGGANIKVADGLGYAASHAFPLWRESARLGQRLRGAISDAPPSNHLAVTMTGELADCFATKAEGVAHILKAVAEAGDNRHTRVYLCDGRMVTPQVALREPQLAAASNWHALARFAGRFAPPGPSLLVDIGSTTTDIVPLVNGQLAAHCLTDTTRLIANELVYTGVERSPVCAVVQHVPYRGKTCGVAQELFATMLDVYLLLGKIDERTIDTNTADGKPAVKAAARTRLGRMIAADCEEFNHRDAVQMAEAVASAQLGRIVEAARQVIKRLPAPPKSYILSGQGEFLAMQALEDLPTVPTLVRLSEKLAPPLSRCAPAHALAVLAQEGAGMAAPA